MRSKIGMLCNAEIVQAVAQALAHGQAECIVIDPVMISTSGHRLLDQEAVQWMKRKLFPMAQLITPNLPEAEALCGMRVRDEAEMERAARLLSDQTGAAVLLKGGASCQDGGRFAAPKWGSSLAPGPQGGNSNTHGTGCTLSSAIACGLARGQSLVESARAAKEYLTNALRAGLDLGSRERAAQSYVSADKLIKLGGTAKQPSRFCVGGDTSFGVPGRWH